MPGAHRARYPDLISPLRQPLTRARVDWGHPLARGLMGCWLFNESALPRDLVTGKQPTMNGGQLYERHVANAWGRAAYASNTAARWLLGPANLVYAASSTFGLIRIRRATGNGQATFGDASLNVHLPWTDNNVYWDYPTSGSRISVAVPASNQAADLLERWVLHAGAAGRGIWLNGSALSSVGTPTTTATPGSGDFSLNAGAGSSTGELQEFMLFCTWGRQLSDMEIRMWSEAPYSFLALAG